jgi:hypothetical protein
MGYTKAIKKKLGIKTQIYDLYTLFSKYKGKYSCNCLLLSFLTGRSNQSNFFTRLLHLSYSFQRLLFPYSHKWMYLNVETKLARKVIQKIQRESSWSGQHSKPPMEDDLKILKMEHLSNQ